MADDVVIRAEGLGKKYLIGHAVELGWAFTFRDAVVRGANNLWRKAADMARGRPIVAGDTIEEFWALKDVSFEVKRGEVLGIIGRNGAGKSTLLKILSRITDPSEGRVTINGLVASLLEVGTGFHPELTGRENIYLNGAILGMTHAEIRRKFDEIVAFAEVEKFLDTPVKRYSSGMYVRLAFAVAAHLEPEILVVDEVLAVGDAQFQKKCLGKMSEVAGGGRTVLFVSHNVAAIQHLCSNVMFLDGGRVVFNGPKSIGLPKYLSSFKGSLIPLHSRADRMGDGSVIMTSIELCSNDNKTISAVASGAYLRINLYFKKVISSVIRGVAVSISAETNFSQPVFLHHNRLSGVSFGELPDFGCFILQIPELPLPPGNYIINCSITKDDSFIDRITHAAEFSVVGGNFFSSGEVPPISYGVCLVKGTWSIARHVSPMVLNDGRA